MVKIDLTQVVGQTLPQNILKKTLQNQKLASAYLFYGPEGLGKWVAALELAKALNCENKDSVPCQVCSNCVKIAKLSHPDVVLVFPVPSTKKEEENLRQKYIASFRGEKLKERRRGSEIGRTWHRARGRCACASISTMTTLRTSGRRATRLN